MIELIITLHNMFHDQIFNTSIDHLINYKPHCKSIYNFNLRSNDDQSISIQKTLDLTNVKPIYGKNIHDFLIFRFDRFSIINENYKPIGPIDLKLKPFKYQPVIDHETLDLTSKWLHTLENYITITYQIKNPINYSKIKFPFFKHVDLLHWLETWETFTYSISKLDINSSTTIFTFKLSLCILILILIRGGVPRYRYDYLTKIGWIRFLAWTLTVFLITLLLILIF